MPGCWGETSVEQYPERIDRSGYARVSDDQEECGWQGVEAGSECGIAALLGEMITDIKQFSDEFNTPGRTFYDEDDPFFQAVDLWYGVTMDKEVCLVNDRSEELSRLTGYSGTTPTRSSPTKVLWKFDSTTSRITAYNTDLA